MSVVVLGWEYLVWDIQTVDRAGTIALLNQLGEKGWELITIRNSFYYFKKPKQTAHVA
jgi:hypothetical protein